MSFDEQIAEISAWLDKKSQTPPAPNYRLNYVISIKGPPRFEWREKPKPRFK